MADLTIAHAAVLTGAGTASGDLFPLVDVSASAGSQGSRIARDELRIAMGVTGGGTVATGGYTLTVPATGTAALLGTVTDPKTVFVSASLGNDGTAVVGSPTKPYATAQAAFDAWTALNAPGRLHVLDGTLSGITLAADMSHALHITGNGPASCKLGGITANGANGAVGAEDQGGQNGSPGWAGLFTSDYSVNCGNISGNGGDGGSGGTPTNVNTGGGVGGACAPMRLLNLLCERVDINGGTGGGSGSFDGGDGGGFGGSMQDVLLSGVITRGSAAGINIAPGAGGGGTVNGDPGSAGMALVLQCRCNFGLNVQAATGGVLNNIAYGVSVTGGVNDSGNTFHAQSIDWP